MQMIDGRFIMCTSLLEMKICVLVLKSSENIRYNL